MVVRSLYRDVAIDGLGVLVFVVEVEEFLEVVELEGEEVLLVIGV